MVGWLCKRHFLQALVESAAWRDPDLAAAGNKERDERRGVFEGAPAPAKEIRMGPWPGIDATKEDQE